jgi:hypothetical protein
MNQYNAAINQASLVCADRRKCRAIFAVAMVAINSLLVACTGLKTQTPRHWDDFSSLLSRDDIQQIKALVAARRDLEQPVWQIATEEGRRNRAKVSCGRWMKVGDESDYFYVEKRNGQWKIISPVRHDRLKAANILVTS